MFSIAMSCENTISVNASSEKVKAVISDFSQWPIWSPWICMEPDCAINVRGEVGEAGHKQAWDGKRIGSGEIILVQQTQTQLDYDLLFLKPWKSSSKVSFIITPLSDNQTKISWTMQSTLPFFMFFMKKMMVAMIESDYQRGLSMLKEYLETGKVVAKSELTGQITKSSFHYIGIRKATTIANMPKTMESDFEQLMQAIRTGRVPPPDDVLSFTHKFDFVSKQCEFTSALAYKNKPEYKQSSDIQLIEGSIPEHKVLQSKHTGPYHHIGNSWSMVMAEQRNSKLKMNKLVPWYEHYLNSPKDTAPEVLQTTINIPVK